MKVLEFTMQSGNPLTLFIGQQNVSVRPDKDGIHTYVEDGTHGNGGWLVAGNYDDVVAFIAMKVRD
jgi:hypothetical protein